MRPCYGGVGKGLYYIYAPFLLFSANVCMSQYLPVLIGKVEAICEENGLRNDSIVMRMTGCPNGCARPYVAEVAFVGKAPGTYLMLLGGGYYGQRLNKIYRGLSLATSLPCRLA